METGTTWYDDKTMQYLYWVMPADFVIIPTSAMRKQKATFDHYHAWLTQTLGPGGWWYDDSKWLASDRKYFFKDEKDRMLFLLRFAGE